MQGMPIVDQIKVIKLNATINDVTSIFIGISLMRVSIW